MNMLQKGQGVTVGLAGGDLTVSVERSDLPIGFLCGFASRRNPKRPFLFVSRVLGRHLPVHPQVMRMVHRRLAAKLLAKGLPGPAVVIGMAETAVCLGQGVHEAWRRMARRDDLLFMHSTRYSIGHPLVSTFEESHSHATSHLLYQPADPQDAGLFADCRTLVLVDDEASTGATFVALSHACKPRMPNLERIVCVTITDWMGEDKHRAVCARMPARTEFVSLLEGAYGFRASDAPPPVMPDVTGNGSGKDHLLVRNFGRLGMRKAAPLPESALAVRAKAGERILVLGTGEFVYPPFQLARRLSAMGADVRVQATTRSPILEGNDIQGVIEFEDAYEDGIPNFIYSVRPGQYDRVLVCYETPPATVQAPLVKHLNAEPVFFSHPSPSPHEGPT